MYWLYLTGIKQCIYAPTIILLMGMWMSLTKKPMKPMMPKPMAVAMAILENSFLSGLVHLLTSLIESLANCFRGSTAVVIWSILRLLFWRAVSLVEVNQAIK